MDNFTYYIPTKIYFGKDSIHNLPEALENYKRVMLVYGEGSIMRNGIYKQVKEVAREKIIAEFAGVKPNPDTVMLKEAIAIAKSNDIDFLLAVGGGSVIDATKYIAAGFYLDGDPWRLISDKQLIEKALPVGTILTMPATSSEMNHIGVISNSYLKEKFSFRSPKVFPEFSILDPYFTQSLSKKQLGHGIADAALHVMEQYLNDDCTDTLQNGMAEVILKTIIVNGLKVLKEADFNYDSRSNLMWAQSWALNTAIQMGVKADLATHKIGHEITAMFGTTHAESLTAVYPKLLGLIAKKRPQKLSMLGRNVFDIQEKELDILLAQTIQYIKQFFISCGLPVSLKEIGLTNDDLILICDRFIDRGQLELGGMKDIKVVEFRNLFLSF